MSGEGPIKITDTAKIAICTCMQSNHWPFCDATHHNWWRRAGNIRA